MAEKHVDDGQDGFGTAVGIQGDDESVKTTSKRCSSTSPCKAPPHKSPRTDVPSDTMESPDAEGGKSKTQQDMHTENTEEPSKSTCPTARRKSWRRATITRRSLPALPNQYQVLCKGISSSLSHQERLEKLMEASMRLAIERTQNSLVSVPKASMETFQKQVEHIQKEWGCLAKSIYSESQDCQVSASATSDHSVQRAMEKVWKAINRFQAESESWEALLNKHRSKAEDLERKVAQGQESGVSLDSMSVVHSSQYDFIQRKPDYRSFLCKQQPLLQTMAVIMDTQCKMVSELLFIQEQSQSLVKETSSRLAADAGFQDLSPDLVKNLIATPLCDATT